MAGLDTRGLASGFALGFGLMDSFYNRQERSQQRERGLEMREQAFEADMAQRQREQDQLLAKSGYARLAAGQELSEDQLAAFQRNPWMAPWHVATDEMGAAIEQAARVADPGDPADLNDPASIKAVNDMFGPRINRGHGKNKRIRAALPGPQPGTLVFELDVEDEGGNRYTAPMTRNRGKAGEDDEVLATDVGTMVEQVAGYQALRKVLSTPGARERALAYGRALGYLPEPEGRWETVEGPGGAILQRHTITGELKEIVGREDSDSWYSRPTSSMKEAQWLVQQGIAPDISAAYEMVRARAGQEQTQNLEYIDFLGSQIERIDEQLDSYQTSEEERIELRERREQLVAELVAASHQIFERPRQGVESNPEPRQNGSSGLQPAPGSPENGEAVKISGDEEYNALPSGALFVGPDGVVRRKP